MFCQRAPKPAYSTEALNSRMGCVTSTLNGLLGGRRVAEARVPAIRL